MRRTVCFAMLVLGLGVLAATALAASPADAGDEGTLSIKRADGLLDLEMRGAVLGRMGRGELAVEIPFDRSCEDLKVWGAEDEEPEAVDFDPVVGVFKRCEYAGKGIRFRIGGRLVVEIRKGRNFFISAVGRGTGRIDGIGGADGVWSLNDADPRSLPNKPTPFELAPPG